MSLLLSDRSSRLVGAHFEPNPYWKGRVRVVAEDHGDTLIVTRTDGRYRRRVQRKRLLSSKYSLKRGAPEETPQGWLKYPALTERPHSGCLHCGSKPLVMPLDANPHPGFGGVTLYRDGEYVTSPDISRDEEVENFVVQDFEDIAAGDPDHDWQMRVDGPLSDQTYQRHGDGLWVCIEKGMGFA